MEIAENTKYAKVQKLIYHNYALDENFSIFQNSQNYSEINRVFLNLILPYKSATELIKEVQSLGELTFHSFKRIYLPKGDKEILFGCSSISPKKSINHKETNLLSTDSSSDEIKNLCDFSKSSPCRNLKRENCESCPMRLKFKFEESSQTYILTEDSNFNHNHSSISVSSEVNFLFIFR